MTDLDAVIRAIVRDELARLCRASRFAIGDAIEWDDAKGRVRVLP